MSLSFFARTETVLTTSSPFKSETSATIQIGDKRNQTVVMNKTNGSSEGWTNIMKRSKCIDSLVDGALLLTLTLRVNIPIPDKLRFQ